MGCVHNQSKKTLNQQDFDQSTSLPRHIHFSNLIARVRIRKFKPSKLGTIYEVVPSKEFSVLDEGK